MRQNHFTLGLAALTLISLSALTALGQNDLQKSSNDPGRNLDISGMQRDNDSRYDNRNDNQYDVSDSNRVITEDVSPTPYVVNRPVSDGDTVTPCDCTTTYYEKHSRSCSYKKYCGCHYRYNRKHGCRLFRRAGCRGYTHYYNSVYSNYDYGRFGRCCW